MVSIDGIPRTMSTTDATDKVAVAHRCAAGVICQRRNITSLAYRDNRTIFEILHYILRPVPPPGDVALHHDDRERNESLLKGKTCQSLSLQPDAENQIITDIDFNDTLLFGTF